GVVAARLEGPVGIEEVARRRGVVEAPEEVELAVGGVEVKVEVEADLLEEGLVDEEEPGLDVDLHRADLAELAEQALDGAVVLGCVGDDQVAVELLDEAGVAAVLAPAVVVDLLGDDVDDVLGALVERAVEGGTVLVLVVVLEGALAAGAAA